MRVCMKVHVQQVGGIIKINKIIQILQQLILFK